MSLESWGGFGGSLPDVRRDARFDDPFGPGTAQGAPVQLDRGGLRDEGATGAGLAQVAAHGLGGPEVDLPYRDQIQAAFGRHDLGGVRAHVGGPAAEAADAMGAEAYATGGHAAFAGPPTLRTAAHEAAHLVQQQAGVQLAGGVGEAGDHHERHADEVADRVVAGESAEDLLDQVRPAGGASAQASSGPVQRLTKRFKPKDSGSVDNLEKVAAHIDKFTMEAHGAVLKALKANKPDLVKDSVGENYYTNWIKNTNPMTTGYIIESYVTGKVKDNGFISSQVVHGNARPDFVIRDDLGQLGIVDITSTKEAGHVLDKDFNPSGFAYIGESLYPSIDHSDIDNSKFDFSKEDVKLIAESNQRRAKASLGERVSHLKKNLGLIADQEFINRQAAQSAKTAIKAINVAYRDLTDVGALGQADQAIEQTAQLYGNGIGLAKMSTLLGNVMSKYDVDVSVFA